MDCCTTRRCSDRSTPLEQYPLEQWREVMKVNVEAAFVLTRALLPALMAAPEASVVFSSSGVGRRGRAYWGAYAVSKFAVEGLSQVLADELQNTTRIRVNCINPGATNTTHATHRLSGRTAATQPVARGDHVQLSIPDGAGKHGDFWPLAGCPARITIATATN